uniref:Uncharacterized protein n=1 Tax=Panagrolaimus davidi TaxID=227884 RepID=A0A914Q5L0_9BILA
MSTTKSKMDEIKEAFLGSVNSLAAKSTDADSIGVNIFYERSYDFARLSHLYPDYIKFTSDETDKFCQNFPTAALNSFHSTTSLYQNSHQNSVNWLKFWRSKIVFIKNEICELFKKYSSDSSELMEVINGLEHEETFLQEMLENREGGEGLLEDSYEVPNLNGVPESHEWWTDKDRSLWKDKDAFDRTIVDDY